MSSLIARNVTGSFIANVFESPFLFTLLYNKHAALLILSTAFLELLSSHWRNKVNQVCLLLPVPFPDLNCWDCSRICLSQLVIFLQKPPYSKRRHTQQAVMACSGWLQFNIVEKCNFFCAFCRHFFLMCKCPRAATCDSI